jgi:septum formation protein
MSALQLLLASASPRRRDLLRDAGLAPVITPPSVDERALGGETARQMVLRLAEVKARSVAADLADPTRPRLVLAADTAVVIDGKALGKPRSAEEAIEMLRLLRGRTHEVLTGVFLLRTDDGRSVGGVESTRVRFRDYDDTTIRAYVESGEPMGKAGAYAIQGGGAALADCLEGSWSNVVGLPMERLEEWMGRIGAETGKLVSAPAPDALADGSPDKQEAGPQELDSTNSS